MARESDHKQLVESALRENAEQRLDWLRNPSAASAEGAACARLLGVEGQESLEQALRNRRYQPVELKQLPLVLADLARERVMWGGRRWLGAWQARALAVGSSERAPAQVLAAFVDPVRAAASPTEAWRALGADLDAHAVRFVELRQRADEVAQAQLTTVTRSLPQTKQEKDDTPDELALAAAGHLTQTASEAPQPAPPTGLELAKVWLDGTDDATRELTRWVIRRTELPASEGDLARLCGAMRARELDGLARPARRFYRLAEGARRLGFERDMTTRMHGESSGALLHPGSACVALSIPHDIRVLQPALDYGMLSDISVAQALGEGLALALTSPATGQIVSQQRGMSVSGALGGLFAQLRATPDYLRRVDGLDREVAEKAARHAAIWLLLRTRLHAATSVAMHAAVRTNAERISQLVAAGERALGMSLPAGIMALQLLAADGPTESFAGLYWGFALHAALRERFDDDYYLNPRVSEVIRGAAARGGGIDAVGITAELGSSGSASLGRVLELLG